MSASLFHRDLGSRRVWLSGVGIVASIGIIAVLWKPIGERYFPTTTPIENILWTASPDYKIFFGPGTPPSVDLAKRLRMMNKEYGVPDRVFNFPNSPVFISPTMFTSNGAPNTIEILSPFTPQAALYIRAESVRGHKAELHTFLSGRLDQLLSGPLWPNIGYRQSGDSMYFQVPKDIAHVLESSPKNELLFVLSALRREKTGWALSIINMWSIVVSQDLHHRTEGSEYATYGAHIDTDFHPASP